MQVLSVAKIKNSDTYCLKVPFAHAFSVNNGILVHNCLRYTLIASGFGFKDHNPPKEPDPITQRRGHSIEEDFYEDLAEMEIDSDY